MLRKAIMLGIFLLILVSVINAQTPEELADQYHELAVEALASGDCKNASEYIYRAFDLYTQQGNTFGIAKSEDIIKKVNDCLRSAGDNHYIQALNFDTKCENYLRSGDYENAKQQCDMALFYIYNANSSYQYMLPPNTELIDKVEVKYQQTRSKIIESELLRADNIYSTALNLFQSDPLTARVYAKNASDIYEMYVYTEKGREGMDKCQRLLDEILQWIVEKREYADYRYERGVEAYTTANCTNKGFFDALKYFNEAKNTYTLINELTGVENCDYIIEQTNKRLALCKETMLEIADEYYTQANELYILAKDIEECDEATNITLKARSLYQGINEIFHDATSSKGISNCNSLLNKIEEKRAKFLDKTTAREWYNTAVKLFAASEYENSSVFVEKARKIFEAIEDWSGVTQCDRLIDDINAVLKQMDEAKAYYEKSLDYYKNADYGNATIYVDKARDIYINVSRTREIAMCNETLKDIQSGNKTKTSADQYYEDAVKHHDYMDYGTAREKADEALRLYTKINYVRGIEKTEAFLENLPEPVPPITLWVIIPLSIISAVIIIFMWGREKVMRISRGKKREVEKKEEEERRKREEMEAERRKREQAREKLEVERRKIREMLEKEKAAITGTIERAETHKNKEEKTRLEEMIERETETIRIDREAMKGDTSHRETSPETGEEPKEEKPELKEMIKKERDAIRREKEVPEGGDEGEYASSEEGEDSSSESD